MRIRKKQKGVNMSEKDQREEIKGIAEEYRQLEEERERVFASGDDKAMDDFCQRLQAKAQASMDRLTPEQRKQLLRDLAESHRIYEH